MSVADSTSTDSETPDCIQNLPKYSEYFKFLLIEELLLEDYRLLHYGKCRVIGKLLRETSGETYLENVRITDLPREYSLPEGTLKIHLLNANTKNTTFRNNSFVEVLGEVFLRNDQESLEIQTPLTSRGVVEQLQSAKTPEDIEKLLNHLMNHYSPALRVWFVSSVDRASDLISRNLEIRMLDQEVEAL